MKSLSFIKAIPALGLLNLYACAPLYQPNVINTPLLNKRHDTRIAAYISSTSDYDAQVAYAITDHIGVMFNGYYKHLRAKTVRDNNIKNYLLEGGLGYFKSIEGIKLEAYAGYGIGQNDSRFAATNNGIYFNNTAQSVVTANMQRFFVQGSFGHTSDLIEFAATLRYSIVNVDEFYTDQDVRGYFLEPLLTLKYGIKNLKVVAKTGISIGGFPDGTEYAYRPIILSVGLEGSIGARQKTPSTTPPITY